MQMLACCLRWDFVVYRGTFFYKIIFFSAQIVSAQRLSAVSFRKFCSVVAVLKFKCLACLPGMNFYRDMKVFMT